MRRRDEVATVGLGWVSNKLCGEVLCLVGVKEVLIASRPKIVTHSVWERRKHIHEIYITRIYEEYTREGSYVCVTQQQTQHVTTE